LFTRLSAFAARTRAADPTAYKDGRFSLGPLASVFQATASDTQLLAFVANEEPTFSDALREVVKMQWTRDYQARAPRQGVKRVLDAPEQPPTKIAPEAVA
jgi:hypothetical protein